MAAFNDPQRILTVLAHQFSLKRVDDLVGPGSNVQSRNVARMLLIHDYLEVGEDGVTTSGGNCYLSDEVGAIPEILEPSILTKMLYDLSSDDNGRGLIADYDTDAVQDAVKAGWVAILPKRDPMDVYIRIELTPSGKRQIDRLTKYSNYKDLYEAERMTEMHHRD